MKTVDDVNAMNPADFLTAFGDVAEHSPWVASEAAAFRPFSSREAMIDAFEHAVRSANRDAQLKLICAHPDLATRARLTEDSSREQQGAGLDCLSEDEFGRFTAFNETYKTRCGFPFIFAVQGATKHMILESFAERVKRSVDQEFQTALAQVCRIFRFRIEDRVAP